jgi:hypothetical protein
MEENNLPQQETNLSNQDGLELDAQFDNLSDEEKLGTLMHEIEFLTERVNNLLPELSNKQLQRTLKRVLAYPISFPEPPRTQIEVDASVLAAKIEHFKILTIKIAADLDNKQKEETNGSTEQV